MKWVFPGAKLEEAIGKQSSVLNTSVLSFSNIPRKTVRFLLSVGM